MERFVGKGVGEVEEKRLLLVVANKADCFLGIAFGQSFLVCWSFKDLITAHERQFNRCKNRVEWFVQRLFRRIIAVGQAEKIVEALFQGTKARQEAEMPFTDAGCGIA